MISHMREITDVVLTRAERTELLRRSRSRSGRADDARIARVLLLLADGSSYLEVQREVGCSAPFVSKWKKRFLEERLAGLYARHEGRPVEVLTPRMEARILAWTQKRPTDGSTHWSTRRLAKKLGVHHMMVARTWKKYGLQPHRVERYKASNDPDFETKAADVIGLYMNPPQRAAVFCVDEKTAIQALDRRDPILPMSPGRAERHGFEYVRHGTMSLYAAFNTKTGEVLGKTVRRHTSQEFVAFPDKLVVANKRKREIHVILDNLSAHKTKRVRQFLDDNPKVSLHFTPTYSSWLNQVELWFSKIERDLIYRGVFKSTRDLTRQIMKYIRKYNDDPKPVKWTYDEPARRINPAKRSVVTVH
jgi:transposase